MNGIGGCNYGRCTSHPPPWPSPLATWSTLSSGTTSLTKGGPKSGLPVPPFPITMLWDTRFGQGPAVER